MYSDNFIQTEISLAGFKKIKKKPTDKAHDLLPNRSLEFVYYFYIWQWPFPQPASTESPKFFNCLLYTPVGTPFAIYNEY